MSHNQNNDGRELKQERQESKSERLEKKAENRERREAVSELSSGSLNEQKRQEQNQEKADRGQSLAEQIQKKGVAKIGPITNHFRQSIEITKTDAKTGKVETLVKGRTQEEVDQAQQLKHLQEASEQGMLIGAGGNFTAAKPSINEQLLQVQKDIISQGAPPDMFVQSERATDYKVRYVPAGTAIESRGRRYELNELTAQAEPSTPMKGVPAIERDGTTFYQGRVSNEEQAPSLIEGVREPIQPAVEAVSKFTADSSKGFNTLVEQTKEAVGLSKSKDPEKPIHQATGDGSTLPKPIQNAGDAAQLGAGYVTGFVKTVDQAMPGMTPRGAIEGIGEAAKQAAGLAKSYAEHEDHRSKDPIGTMVQDALNAKKMYDSAVDWANKRSQTESFAERGQDIGKASPDVLMASEIVFIARSGKLITPRDAAAMKLESKTAEELENLEIRQIRADQLKPEDVVNPIDRNASPQEKVRQLQQLSAENQPLIDEFKKQIDDKYGSFSYGEPKNPETILSKAVRAEVLEKKPWFRIEHIRDSQRFTTVVDNLDKLPELAADLKNSGFQVLDAAISKMQPNERGWRMMPFDLRTPNGQLVEYQVLPREMYQAGIETHPIHEKWRGKEIRTLSQEESKLRNKDLLRARRMCESAWASYLKRTGQTMSDVNAILQKVSETFE